MARDDDFSSFDHHAKDARVGAEDVWARMRACPALPHSDKHGGFRVVAKFEDLSAALLDFAAYSSAAGITLPAAQVRTPHIPAEIDPPLQRDYRTLLARFLTKEKVKDMEDDVRALTTRLLDAIKRQTRIDFFAAFARPLPVYVSLGLVGLPPEDGPLLDDLVMGLHEEIATQTRTGAADKLTKYIEDALVARHGSVRDPNESIIASIILGKVEGGRPMSLDEQVSMLRLLLIGGFDTTAIALSTAMWWLAEHPEDAQRLRDDPALIETAIDEFVRFSSPASYLRRTVTGDATLGGTRLCKGDHILLAFGAANRDETQFANAEGVVLDRAPNHHLGFGLGAHRCIGSFVAKLEMRVALEEILRRYRGFEVDPAGAIKWSSGGNQGIVALPLILTPA